MTKLLLQIKINSMHMDEITKSASPITPYPHWPKFLDLLARAVMTSISYKFIIHYYKVGKLLKQVKQIMIFMLLSQFYYKLTLA